MSVDLAQAVWEELKRYIGPLDRTEAADALVSLLVDHNYSSDDIKSSFKGDAEIKKSIQVYIGDHTDEDDDEDDEDDERDIDDY